jgi:hypothetical protein
VTRSSQDAAPRETRENRIACGLFSTDAVRLAHRILPIFLLLDCLKIVIILRSPIGLSLIIQRFIESPGGTHG